MNKNWVMVDVEANGPCPGLYSMIELGAVHVTTKQTFYTTLRPFGAKYLQASLDVTGHTHEETLTFKDSTAAITRDSFPTTMGSIGSLSTTIFTLL